MSTRKDTAPTLTAASDQPAVRTIDVRRMAVKVIISTQAPDRSGDVVVTRGIDCVNHRKNPVVLFDHGLSTLQLPIGKACDPAGAYEVRLEDERAVSVTHFSQTLPEAEQIFRLIEEGILCGASIGFRPKPGGLEALRGLDQGVRVNACELIEYSHVAIPDNQDALTVAVQKGRVGATRLSAYTMKALQSQALQVEVRRQARELANAYMHAILKDLRAGMDTMARNHKRLTEAVRDNLKHQRSKG